MNNGSKDLPELDVKVTWKPEFRTKDNWALIYSVGGMTTWEAIRDAQDAYRGRWECIELFPSGTFESIEEINYKSSENMISRSQAL